MHHKDRIAIREGEHQITYQLLMDASQQMASILLQDEPDLKEERIAFMANPGFDYVKTLWGIWQAGGIAVPLFLHAPPSALQYVLSVTGAGFVIASEEFEDLLRPICSALGIHLLVLSDLKHQHSVALPTIDSSRAALILYTSGTTNLPKGVVITHRNLEAQISTLVSAWEWSTEDHTLCVLPLHHVHGIVNVVCCSLWAGACCEFLPAFEEESVFKIFSKQQVNVFMAVPTIYYKLIAYWDSREKDERDSISLSMAKFRLMVSGSAALPVSVMERWKAISHHILLERYGMTEIGMAISNPYHGKRKPGSIGLPLPGVEVRLCDDTNRPVGDEPGEIQVRGANVFKGYWKKDEVTQQSFTKDGWFKTGDIAVVDDEGYYRILGRNSLDIIKSGGYKISAIEIEEILRQYHGIKDCSVIGIPDDEWGEVISAILVTETVIDLKALHAWLRERLSNYKIPRQFKILSELPRNTMGKVMKNELKLLFSSTELQ